MLKNLLAENGVLLDQSRQSKEITNASIKPAKLETAFSAAWVSLRNDIFKYYKDGKATATMALLTTEFAEQIVNVNNLLNDARVDYISDGVYLKAFVDGIRVAQFSTKNQKLMPNKHGQGFLLWSVLGHITCNGKTDLCSRFCYNNSKSVNGILELKIDCLILSLMDRFVEIIGRLIKLSPHRDTFVRIHEDGDFYSQEYFNKWLEISESLPETQFMAYTKEPELLGDIKTVNSEYKNFVLRFSLMEDTAPEIQKAVISQGLPSFIAIGEGRGKVAQEKADELFNLIPMKNRCLGSCQMCKKCYIKECDMIAIKIH